MSKEIREAYETLAKNSGIKEGSTVRVLRSAKMDEMGWDNSWTESMDRSIGKVFKVRNNDFGKGFMLNDTSWMNYPFFVLEIVENPKHSISIDGEDVEISHESYQALRKLFNKEEK